MYDIDLTHHRSTNIIDSDILNMDLVLCATLSHKISVLHMYPELKGKVYTMKEYVGFIDENKEYDIKDPWGYGLNIFIECAAEIKQCIDKTIEKITREGI